MKLLQYSCISCIKLHIFAYPPTLSGELDLRRDKDFKCGSIVWKSMILEFHIFGNSSLNKLQLLSDEFPNM